jgi:dihydrolipoamide dehydrogenase
MKSMKYDLIIIGGGPGGYVAAERAGEAGKKVLLFEEKDLGGVCLNRGCIPTKSLLNSAKQYHHALHGEKFGVTAENVTFNLSTAMAWKEKTVSSLRKGVAFLMKKGGVEIISERAILGPGKKVEAAGKEYEGEAVIIAAGASPARIPIPGSELDHVLTSDEILEIENLPKGLAVIGGGVIGLEFASFFSSLGVKVSVIEMLDEILPMMDKSIAKTMRKAMKDVDFHLSSRLEKIEPEQVHFSSLSGKQANRVEAEMVLLATGRSPNIENLGLADLGIDFDGRGIRVDEYQRTNIPGIYAVGDITGRSQLAHSASRMGEVAVGHILDPMEPSYGKMRYQAIPWAVYTLPEAAGCGLTEEEATKQGIPWESASYHFAGNGRFLAENGKDTGFCTILSHKESGILLGIHMIGPYSSEIIHSAAVMIESELRVKDIKEIIFPHPTVSETVRDACWGMKE